MEIGDDLEEKWAQYILTVLSPQAHFITCLSFDAVLSLLAVMVPRVSSIAQTSPVTMFSYDAEIGKGFWYCSVLAARSI